MIMCNGRACVVDLSSGGTSEQELSEESFMKGSVALAESLRREHGDAIVLGTGLLTGSLIPAACAGLVSSSRGVTPLMGLAGVELKLSGFDFVVLKGVSEVPCYVWIRDGMAEVVGYGSMSSMDSWERVERIRADQGDRRIQVVAAGPWGDAQRPAAPLTVSHWLGEDDVFAGAEFGRRRLLAVAFRGMGELELADPEGHLSASLSLRAAHAERLGQSSGLSSYWDGAAEPGFSSLLHRNVSCYGCPHPCRSFLKVNEDPGQMALVAKEPGYLHFDIPSLDAALSSGMNARDATLAFMKCAKAGADAASVVLSGAIDVPGVEAALASGEVSGSARSSAVGAFRSLPDFETCVSLGFCPRYWAKSGLDRGEIAECAETALGRSIG